MDTYCSNCCKCGHSYPQCKMPIISIGIVAFTQDEKTNEFKFLMIRRKDTLGFMDFMRGKYSIYNKEYIINLLKEMTIIEKENLLKNDFDTLWNELWLNNQTSPLDTSSYWIEETQPYSFNQLKNSIRSEDGSSCPISNFHGYKKDTYEKKIRKSESVNALDFIEPMKLRPTRSFEKGTRKDKEQWCKTDEIVAHEKYNALVHGIMTQSESYTLQQLIEESNMKSQWVEAEWGFPKGRRNYNESDMVCAIREFVEETGYSQKHLYNIDNIQPFEEIFMGSNYKSYKHKYYLMKFDGNIKDINPYDKSEVSKIEWKTYQECIDSIRDYNLEKKRVISNIYNCLNTHKLA